MKTFDYADGITIIICCYNSVPRLLPTLQALAGQRFGAPLLWEIILVDNASTDSTATVAAAIWADMGLKSNIPLIVIKEEKPGQAYARQAGIQAASFGYVLFCDDDNWLSENYVQGMYDILKSDDSIAACGGRGVPVFEKEKPEWFDAYAEAYAVGDQQITMESGRLLNLYGAGMAMRLRSLHELYRLGFKPVMAGRTGSSLSSSDDTELTYALVISGYRLEYAPRFLFSHFLPASRMSMDYLKKLFIAFGNDGPVRNLYYAQLTQKFAHRMMRYWPFHLVVAFTRFIKYLIVPPKKNGRSIYYHWSVAYIRSLFAIKNKYAEIRNGIQVISQ